VAYRLFGSKLKGNSKEKGTGQSSGWTYPEMDLCRRRNPLGVTPHLRQRRQLSTGGYPRRDAGAGLPGVKMLLGEGIFAGQGAEA
jgi:hypothetical protein